MCKYVTQLEEPETECSQAEEMLREKEKELELKTRNLKEVNTALKVLLKRRDEDKTELEQNVLSNLRKLIFPYLEKLKKSGLNTRQNAYIRILQSNLNNIISPFSRRLSSKYLNLTPTEIQVANLVRHGRNTKKIAEILNVSTRTIEFHRGNIRKKFGIKNKNENLRSHLLSIN